MAISKKSDVIWVHCRNSGAQSPLFWSAPTTQTLAGHALLKIFQPEFSALRISMYFLWFVQSIFSGWLEPRSPIMARQKGDLANFNLNVCSGSKTKIQVLLLLCMSFFWFLWFCTRFNFRCANFDSFSWCICLSYGVCRLRVQLKTLLSLRKAQGFPVYSYFN